MDVLKDTLKSCINAGWQSQEASGACQDEKERKEENISKSLKIDYHPLNTRRQRNNWHKAFFLDKDRFKNIPSTHLRKHSLALSAVALRQGRSL